MKKKKREPRLEPKLTPCPKDYREERRIALVIGNNRYRNCDSLKGCRKDARDLTAELQNSNFTVHCLQDATLANMDLYMRNVENYARKRADKYKVTVFFAFSGHGCTTDKGDLTLIPSDDDQSSAFSCTSALKHLSSEKFFLTIFLLDCCRVIGDAKNVQAFRAKQKCSSTFITFACAPEQSAQEIGPEGSYFTQAFCSSLRSKHQPGRDFLATLQAVKARVASHNIPQVPWMEGSIPSKFLFRPPHHHHLLYKVKARGAIPYDLGFICDLCYRESPTAYRWNCSQCLYDMCETCHDI